MKNKDTPRRESDHLVEPSNLYQHTWINEVRIPYGPVLWVSEAGEPVKWPIGNGGGRDIGISAEPKFIIYQSKVTIEVKEPTADENAARLTPALGEALLVLFCPKNRARHMMGDLEEIFHEDIKTKGKRRAKLLYWAAVLRSIGPLLRVRVRKAGLIALLFEIGRRWSGLS
jgi:hypothetical protein